MKPIQLSGLARQLDGAEGRDVELVQEAAEALDLDAVEEAQDQHAERERHRDRQVGGRHDAQVGVRGIVAGGAVELGPDPRQDVDRQQVHRVQQEDPDEHGQRERRDHLAALGVVDDALGLVVDQLEQDLDRGLEAARHARGRLARRAPEQEAAERAEQRREDDRVEVDDREIDQALRLAGAEMGQVVNDVFTGGLGVLCCGCHGLLAMSGVFGLLCFAAAAPEQREPVGLHAEHERRRASPARRRPGTMRDARTSMTTESADLHESPSHSMLTALTSAATSTTAGSSRRAPSARPARRPPPRRRAPRPSQAIARRRAAPAPRSRGRPAPGGDHAPRRKRRLARRQIGSPRPG